MMKKILKHIKLLLRDSLLLLVIGLLISISFGGTEMLKDWSIFIGAVIYTLVIGLSLWRGISLISYLLGKYLSPKTSLQKNLVIHLISSLLYAAIAIFLLNYFLYEALWGVDLLKNVRMFTMIGMIQLFIVIIITAVHYVLDFLKSLRQSVKEQEALKREALHHNYEALKNQLSPHFLFNSLSALSALVDIDKEKSKVFIQQLSEVYRYVLEHKGDELVPLEKEMDFVHSYLFLHEIRNSEGLKVEISIGDVKGFVIPMSVQLLVENALKHNEASEKKPMTIKIAKHNDNTIEVSNTYKPKTGIAGSGLGLHLLKKRCQFMFDRHIEILKENGFYKVMLPMKMTDAHVEDPDH
ncbi:MAG: hypothetical protein EA394_00445 [Bacteroidia bacterium]|nr:MAG: hypothetical protein EA394_00445 [Bacteroidia bacterium]